MTSKQDFSKGDNEKMIRMITEEMVVLEKNAKDVVCKDGKTRTYYNVKCGTGSYENQLFDVPKEVYEGIKEQDRVIFQGSFGGLKTKFWKVDALQSISPNKK